MQLLNFVLVCFINSTVDADSNANNSTKHYKYKQKEQKIRNIYQTLSKSNGCPPIKK